MNYVKLNFIFFILFCANTTPIGFTQKSPYAPYFENVPGDSPIKKTCSTITGNPKIDNACVELSNFLYCIRHPVRRDRPAECQQFCDEQFKSYSGFLDVVKVLQQELGLSPQEIIEFRRNVSKTANNPEAQEFIGSDQTNSSNTPVEERLSC
ncbi:MAG: hypothetical protein WC707_00195 [Candidatus Babeliaceae bacterium]|jgi:hypothetical protein